MISSLCKAIAQNLFFLFFVCINLLSNEETYWGNPTNLEILNSSKDDFAPVWNRFEKRLYLASTRNGIAKFFVANLKDSSYFTAPIEITDPINRTKSSVSYLSFLDETEAVLNSFRLGKRQSYINIFYSQRRLNQWQKPVPLDSLQCECFVLHPTVSENGDFMIFSSNKSNSRNLDLFVAFLLPDGSWGRITNLVELNTDGNEITPFLASDDTLYFASDGYGGPGGYDIYFSTRSETGWSKPIPLSELNTRYNESDFVVINDRFAVFASDRPDGSSGGLDLFLAERLKVRPPEILPAPELKISSQVSSVRLQEEIHYSAFEIPTFLLETDFDKLAEPNSNFDEYSLEGDLDVIKSNFLNIYFNRAKKEKISITLCFDTTNTTLYNLIAKYFAVFFPNDLDYTPAPRVKHSNQKVLQVLAYSPLAFQHLRIGKKEFFFEPPQLEVVLQAQNNEIIKGWNFEIAKAGFSYSNSDLPRDIVINLEDIYPLRNFSEDTLLLKFSASDTLGRIFTQYYPIALNRSFRFIDQEEIWGNRQFRAVYLIADTSNFIFRLGLKDCIDKILSNVNYIRNITFLQTEDWQTSAIEETIKKLKEKTPHTQFEIRSESISSQTFYKNFQRNGYFTVLIERR
ncbi:MAG: hypothetical protein ACUVQ1_05590 [Candidatus Kapaibacteriales bacterium]